MMQNPMMLNTNKAPYTGGFTYLSCSRAGPKTKITLELRACLCTVECKKKTRSKCTNFKALSVERIREAVMYLERVGRAIPRETYQQLPKAAKKGFRPKFCKECGACLTVTNNALPSTCTVCYAKNTILKRDNNSSRVTVPFLPVKVVRAEDYNNDGHTTKNTVFPKYSRFKASKEKD